MLLSEYRQTQLRGYGGSKIPHLPIKFGDSFAEFAKNGAFSGIFTQSENHP
jgi:hypothetical protein